MASVLAKMPRAINLTQKVNIVASKKLQVAKQHPTHTADTVNAEVIRQNNTPRKTKAS